MVISKAKVARRMDQLVGELRICGKAINKPVKNNRNPNSVEIVPEARR